MRQSATHLNHSQLALRQVHELDLFNGNSLASAPVESFVNGPKGTLADAGPEPLDDMLVTQHCFLHG